MSKPTNPTHSQLQLLELVQKYGSAYDTGGGFWCCEPGVERVQRRMEPPWPQTWWRSNTVRACVTRGWLSVHPDEPVPMNPNWLARRYTITPGGRLALAAVPTEKSA